MDIEIKLGCQREEYGGKINYSLIHSNLLSWIESLRICNDTKDEIKKRKIKIEIQGYSEPYSCIIRNIIAPNECYNYENPKNIKLNFDASKLNKPDNRAQMLCYVNRPLDNKEELFDLEETFDLSIMPVEMWDQSDRFEKALACFVLSDNLLISSINRKASELFSKSDKDTLVDIDPVSRVEYILRALKALLAPKYFFEPPLCRGNCQRIRFPQRIQIESMATCIDLALLIAACVENLDIFMKPSIVICESDAGCESDAVIRHALAGFWLINDDCPYPDVINNLNDERENIENYINNGDLILVDPERFARVPKRFAREDEYKKCLWTSTDIDKYSLLYMLNIAEARNTEIMPIISDTSFMDVTYDDIKKLEPDKEDIYMLARRGYSLEKIAKITKISKKRVKEKFYEAQKELKEIVSKRKNGFSFNKAEGEIKREYDSK